MRRMYKIAVIGDKDTVMGFQALGLDVFDAKTDDDAKKIIKNIANDNNYAVIYITEDLAAGIMDTIEKYTEKKIPAIILIPGAGGSMGIGMSGVKKCVERAVGADILFKD